MYSESSILEPLPELCDFIDQPITYYLVDSGTKRGRNKLIDNLGFTYNISKKRPYATYWQCTVCPQGNQCKATVTERDGQFTVGKTAHNHAVQVGALTSAEIVSEVKEKAMKDKYRPASAIVDEVLLKELSDTAPCASLLKLIMTSRADIMPLIAGHKADAACPFTCLLTCYIQKPN